MYLCERLAARKHAPLCYVLCSRQAYAAALDHGKVPSVGLKSLPAVG
eukprot:COSAG06_NODE_70531_length_191_cov_69.065217_1_plen_46_part_01